MALFLSIVQGPLTGDKYEVFDGLKMGRTKGHIKLNDPKSSSLHAKIVSEDGVFVLKDQGSKNGVLVNGVKVLSIELKPGVEFLIGKNLFQVEEIFTPEEGEIVTPPPTVMPLEEEATLASPAPIESAAEGSPIEVSINMEPVPEPAPVREEAKPQVQRRTWNEFLADWASENFTQFTDTPKIIAAFPKPINLVFKRGLQAETVWTLGYGPRTIGPTSLDLPIYESEVPDPCFEILPTATGILFKTSHAEQVLINGSSVESSELKHGDQITIANVLIEVEFIE